VLLSFAILVVARPARGWVENHVTGDEVRVAVDARGVAVVEHRLAVRLNGNERQKSYLVRGVDGDAEPLPNAYVVPAREALGSSLASAVPLELSIVGDRSRAGDTTSDAPIDGAPASEASTADKPIEVDRKETDLRLDIQDEKGILRGAYVFVFRYRTDLRARGMLVRDGAQVRIDWRGPLFDQGFDNARAVFALPAAPSPPRPADATSNDDTSSFIAEVRRTTDGDEIELLRSYVSQHERIVWNIRVDSRAFEPLPSIAPAAPPPSPPSSPVATLNAPHRIQWAIASAVFVSFALLVAAKGRQARRLARAAKALARPCIPLPEPLRIALASAALTAGIALQLLGDRAALGALLVVASAALAAHGAARLDPSARLRGPGRWLALSEKEALVSPAPVRGAVLDPATTAGKLVLLLALSPFAAAAAWLWPRSPHHAIVVALDSIAVLALLATGSLRALPPDLAVEPARFFRDLARVIRRRHGGEALRLVPRARVPHGDVDPDELRLLVVPRLPKRGFIAIEVALTYAIGVGARVAMPEVLLRVASGSPCDDALASLVRRARITPGRKSDERVLAFAPRFPTVRMTAEIAVALAARVADATARPIASPKPEAIDRAA
jgi:hypothetical protein